MASGVIPPARIDGDGIRYAAPLVDGTFLGRRKRFFADVRLDDGTEVVAHCANTGAMTGTSTPGARCRVLDVRGRGRSLDWSLEQMEADGAWTLIHTGRPNRVVEAAIAAGRIPELAGLGPLRRERPYGDGHRIDLASEDASGRRVLVEVKNVTWVQGGVARFPDAVSVRATRHLHALADAVAAGDRAVAVLHVARGDADRVAPADDLDPAFGDALRAARAAGVEVLAGRVAMDRQRAWWAGPLPVVDRLADALTGASGRG